MLGFLQTHACELQSFKIAWQYSIVKAVLTNRWKYIQKPMNILKMDSWDVYWNVLAMDIIWAYYVTLLKLTTFCFRMILTTLSNNENAVDIS